MYRDDLAYVHGAGFGGVADAAAGWLLSYLETHRVPDGRVLDLACGPGRFAARLLRRGHPVVGIDQSRSMIALARVAAPGATFRVGSLRTASWPSASIVTVVGEGLNYMRSPESPRPELVRFFRRVRRTLPPRGLFVFDAITGPLEHLVPRSAFVSSGDWSVGVQTERLRKNTITRRITIFRRGGSGFRRSVERHTIAVLPRSGVVDKLRTAGFGVRVRDGYDRSSTLPGRTVFVARPR